MQRIFPHKFFGFMLLLFLGAFCAGAGLEGRAAKAWAADAQGGSRSPLLIPGKKTLYQRAVSHPGARLLAGPDEKAKVLEGAVTPFTVFYIYGEKGGFTEVGASTSQAGGWVPSASLTPWPQAMTLLFTERAGRDPVLFFRDENALTKLCQAKDIGAELQKIRQDMSASAGTAAEKLPVLASEPGEQAGAVARSHFYLMPIISMKDPFEGAKFLEVASIDPGFSGGKTSAAGSASNGQDGAGNKSGKPEEMRTAVAFVIDTTISMNPYIQQTREVIQQVFDDLERSGQGENAAFALVAFRNSVKATPGLEYVGKVFSDFKTVKDRKALEKDLLAVREATVSSHAFNEDSMAGVKEAIDKLSWDKYPSRLLILISDAGPVPASDVYSSTGMDAAEIRDYARAQNIWITVLHVQSPVGAKDHKPAAQAYQQLTRMSDGRSNYIAIPAPTPQQGARDFARAARALSSIVGGVIKETLAGKAPNAPKPGQPGTPPATPEEQAKETAAVLGYAMRLDFLGQTRKNQAPQVVKAWISDMDLALLAQDKYSPATEVAVLLTKNQLSDLQQQLKIIIDNAERTKKTDSRDFFQGILSASAQLSRDPAAFSKKPGRNLQESGVLAEFLEGLPYKSDIMLLTEDDWYRMSVGEQTAFINRLRSRIARYAEYDRDADNWESFGARDSGDWVYRVPLNMLP